MSRANADAAEAAMAAYRSETALTLSRFDVEILRGEVERARSALALVKTRGLPYAHRREVEDGRTAIDNLLERLDTLRKRYAEQSAAALADQRRTLSGGGDDAG